MNDDTLRETGEADAAASTPGRPVSLDHELIDWAWAQPITNNPGARIVLMCMARRVDDAWECTASQDEIAADALLSSRSVRRHMEQLEDGGFIRRKKRFDEKGHRLPDLCRLNPAMDLSANLADRQVSPLANLDVREGGHRPDWPLVKMATGSDQQESLPANLASGQVDLWADWPVVAPPETDIPSSGPVAKLTSGQIGRASSSPTENYQKKTPSSSSKSSKPKPPADALPREDVERLCVRLLGWMKHNQVRKTPDAVTEAWRREARLLLDKDQVPLDEAVQVLDWCQRDGFWSKNIHSMPTFREKYGRLEMKSRGLRGDAPSAQPRPTGTGSRFAANSGARSYTPTAEELADMEIEI